jgi:hypothetical protein
MMKYRVDDWVLFCPLPDVELFKDERYAAVVLEILNDDLFYDYKIYVEQTQKTKKVRQHQLFPASNSTY